MKTGASLELYTEYPPPGEEALIKQLIALMGSMLKKSYLTGTTYRDTHAKGHAAVKGEFVVDPDLPQELRIGLFKQPRRYPCWLRFANTSPTPQADIKRDIRAMSIKLMGVDGDMLWQSDKNAKTMDLILMGSPTFLAPNVMQFYNLEVALDKGKISALWFFLTHPRIFTTIVKASRKCASLLEVPYFSQTAYRFGTKAVQYHAQPRLPATSRVPDHPPNNFLRERLQEQLASSEVVFDFMVQFQTDPYRMPIEDPMVAWDTALSPYRKVATLIIPPQACNSPARTVFCENLSFNPWRTLPEHRPLGGINRARREVYPAISEFRHNRNNVPLQEPVPDENP